ncbi:hypothetical protein GCM10023314_09300 [Algibacter agarivorans]|uniref:Transposase IS4-like domain-containing protein n=1 Tax=Algibacter agarivorans TaxID=1109741 RepID=A0ABP9GD55_9FLAO
MFKLLPTINILPITQQGKPAQTPPLLIDHVEDHIENYDEKPETLTADAGYGSEENQKWF